MRPVADNYHLPSEVRLKRRRRLAQERMREARAQREAGIRPRWTAIDDEEGHEAEAEAEDESEGGDDPDPEEPPRGHKRPREALMHGTEQPEVHVGVRVVDLDAEPESPPFLRAVPRARLSVSEPDHLRTSAHRKSPYSWQREGQVGAHSSYMAAPPATPFVTARHARVVAELQRRAEEHPESVVALLSDAQPATNAEARWKGESVCLNIHIRVEQSGALPLRHRFAHARRRGPLRSTELWSAHNRGGSQGSPRALRARLAHCGARVLHAGRTRP